MKTNKLVIKINKTINEIFSFCVTPPNSTKWIPNVIGEETNEWPIKIGTIYKLTSNDNNATHMTVVDINENISIEWISKDKNYHCRYILEQIDCQTTIFKYFEWVDKGNIEEPFTEEILNKLKKTLETN